jgi:hypothetical protein
VKGTLRRTLGTVHVDHRALLRSARRFVERSLQRFCL